MTTDVGVDPTPWGNATQRFTSAGHLAGTRLEFDRVVPAARFTEAGTGQRVGPTDFRGRRAIMLVFAHAGCSACNDWLRAVAESLPPDADAELRVVTPGPDPEAAHPLPAWTDPDDGRARLLSDVDEPAVVVLDRFAAVHEAHVAAGHAFPAVDAIAATLRYLSMECGECSV